LADLLEAKAANPFRVGSYCDAAETVHGEEKPIEGMALEEGQSALRALPDLGEGFAIIFHEIAKTGRSSMLEQLKGEIAPVELFKQVPGIGEEFAHRITEQLDVSSLEELVQAAHIGWLEELWGFGEQKIEYIQMSLAGMLSTAA